MKITWLGHASFLIETENKTLLTDPYEPGSFDGAVQYSPINLNPDIILISHTQHADHNYIQPFKEAKIFSSPGKFSVGEIEIEGLLSYHDKSKGRERGENIIFIVSAEGLKVAHFGDLGTVDIPYERLSGVDVVMVPVGGTFTIDDREAEILREKISPRIFIPMHFKTPKIGFAIKGVEEFLKGKNNVERKDFLLVDKKNLPQNKIVVLNHTQ